ncbi:hypothetical protein GCM10009804_35660 [Kribbella hippodromi]|uniref:Uncharacterized protein n=1 Tax=Kribbella hippodromi TaxID=434347 RepID=A0ABN2DH09_9ACTN
MHGWLGGCVVTGARLAGWLGGDGCTAGSVVTGARVAEMLTGARDGGADGRTAARVHGGVGWVGVGVSGVG